MSQLALFVNEQRPSIITKHRPVKTGAGRAALKSTRDPRLDELRHMGLPRVWLQAAEAVGVDAFLKIWRIIDADPSSWHNDTSLRVRLRPYKSYLRFQRNRFIEALTAQGMGADAIKRRLRQQLGEDVSHRHITRLAKAK